MHGANRGVRKPLGSRGVEPGWPRRRRGRWCFPNYVRALRARVVDQERQMNLDNLHLSSALLVRSLEEEFGTAAVGVTAGGLARAGTAPARTACGRSALRAIPDHPIVAG